MSDSINSLFTTSGMDAIFSSAAHIQQMLAFEAALARAEAHAGVISQAAADAIAAGCEGAQFDLVALYREALVAGTPVIPLVRILAAQVAEEGRAFVHWGATSQDAIDTATMLQIRAGLDLLIGDLRGLCKKLRDTGAATSPYGDGWADAATTGDADHLWAEGGALARASDAADAGAGALREHGLALQFGGAVGTLAALGDAGMTVAARLAEELELPLPEQPWHAERDRIATIASALGVVAGSMAKIANDIVLLAQNEVGEANEAAAPGKGGSSAMPHKRNPVDTMEALAAARLATGSVQVILGAMANEHERAIGGWQAEWVVIPDLFRYTAGAVARVASAVNGVQIHTDRMRGNLEQGGGMLMAGKSVKMVLTQVVGRPEAQRLINAALKRTMSGSATLRQTLLDDAEIRAILSPEAIDQALDPARYLGSADVFIERALAAYRALMLDA